MFRYIDVEDSEAVIRAIHMTDREVPIDLVLHTPGGLVLASLQIAQAIKQEQRESDGLCATLCHVRRHVDFTRRLRNRHVRARCFGPVAPQLGKFAAASILKAVARKPVAEVEDETLIMADQAEKAIEQVTRRCERALDRILSSNGKTDELARLLSEGTWTHDYPITYDRAKALGLPSALICRTIY